MAPGESAGGRSRSHDRECERAGLAIPPGVLRSGLTSFPIASPPQSLFRGIPTSNRAIDVPITNATAKSSIRNALYVGMLRIRCPVGRATPRVARCETGLASHRAKRALAEPSRSRAGRVAASRPRRTPDASPPAPSARAPRAGGSSVSRPTSSLSRLRRSGQTLDQAKWLDPRSEGGLSCRGLKRRPAPQARGGSSVMGVRACLAAPPARAPARAPIPSASHDRS